jgi:hypothetical protein
MTEPGERVSQLLQNFGAPPRDAYEHVLEVDRAVKTADWEESSKHLDEPAKATYPPPWKIRRPLSLIPRRRLPHEEAAGDYPDN